MSAHHCRLLTFSFAFLVISVMGDAQSLNEKYDKHLADSLGADAYGMKQYVLTILKTGPATITDKLVSDSLFKGHMENINRLARAGKLIVAGPMRKNEKNYRGIFILNVKTLEEAASLLQSDPAIKAKLLDSESYVWHGSAALPMYLGFHDRIEQKTF